jgi:hypothetical protein
MSSSLKEQTTMTNTVDCTDLSYFDNQISGHSCLLKGTDNPEFLYKPFDRTEAEFYEFLAQHKEHILQNFIPNYYGILKMPKPVLQDIASQICSKEASPTYQLETSDEADNTSNSEENHSGTSDSTNECTNSRSEWFKNLFLHRFNEKNTRFLKLEDLTSEMESPCMLDLKMGSVAYNAKKMEHQMSKLNNSTSSSLKYRICGLQVKNQKNDTEYFRDKYWGRRLKPDDICEAMALFFFDGQEIRRNLVKRFIQMLQDLAAAIKTCVGFKFYSVSLLLTYDSSLDDEELEGGNDCDEEKLNSKIKLRLIDFAKSTFDQECSEIDTDLLTGIENLTKCFKYIDETPEIKPNLL